LLLTALGIAAVSGTVLALLAGGAVLLLELDLALLFVTHGRSDVRVRRPDAGDEGWQTRGG
jgi:hypothetical protein